MDDFRLAELPFWGYPESIKNKLEKLVSLGISEERVEEKIMNLHSLGFDRRLVRLNLDKLLSFEKLSPETAEKRFNELHLCPSSRISRCSSCGERLKMVWDQFCSHHECPKCARVFECEEQFQEERPGRTPAPPRAFENRTPERQNLKKVFFQRGGFCGQRCGTILGENRKVSELPLLSVRLFRGGPF